MPTRILPQRLDSTKDFSSLVPAAFETANAAFVQANNAFNTATNNAAGASLYANGAFLQANAAYGSQNTTGSYANSAYLKANAAYDFANTIGAGSVDSFARGTANAAFIQANAAYTRANNSINANTGGTITGDLIITKNTTSGNIFTSNSISANVLNLTGDIKISNPSGNSIIFANTTLCSQAAQNFSQLYVTSDFANTNVWDGNADYAWAYISRVQGGAEFSVRASVSGVIREGIYWDYGTNILSTSGNISAIGSITGENIIGLVSSNTRKRTLNFIIDGGGSVITTGSKGYAVIDANCTLESWTILNDISGSANVDIKRSTYANFPSTTSIAGTIPPTVTSNTKAQNISLSGWGNTAIYAGDILEFVVQGTPANTTRTTVSLKMVSLS